MLIADQAPAKVPPPAFTVFTPTYNRAHTLHRVYESLCVQTLRDLEWLIVDDGSTDGTTALVEQWCRVSNFPIRFIAQPHAGKHIAHNRAIREARGQFFIILDSDDACVPTALERMLYHWNTIPIGQRAQFSGVAGLCCDQKGAVVGDRYPSEPLDISLREQRYVYRIRGEKWGPELVEVLRQFPFPEISDTNFLPEGAVWLEVAKRYKMRCVNEVFRVYYVDDSRTGHTLTARKSLGESAAGRLHYYTWLLNNDLGYFFHSPSPFIKAAVMLPVMALYASQPLTTATAAVNGACAKALVLAGLPFAFLLYLFDRGRTSLLRRRAGA